MPKDENDPVSPDERLIRCVLRTHVLGRRPAPGGFSVNSNDTDGISFYREACGATPKSAIDAKPVPAKWAYVYLLAENIRGIRVENCSLILSLSAAPDGRIPGHCVIPELNFDFSENSYPLFKQFREKLIGISSDAEYVDTE